MTKLKKLLGISVTIKDVFNTFIHPYTATRSTRPTEGRQYPTYAACNRPCLILVEESVFSDRAITRVLREGEV